MAYGGYQITRDPAVKCLTSHVLVFEFVHIVKGSFYY